MPTEREQQVPSEPTVSEIVIDSSAIAKYSSKEPDWSKVEKYITSGDTLELAIKETGNALWKKILKKEVELDTAKKIVKILSSTLSILDQHAYMDRALEIATRHNISLYDALFLACAKMENSKLVSSDARQLEVARELGIGTIEV
jgi:predicted nucleic acid-binding protein